MPFNFPPDPDSFLGGPPASRPDQQGGVGTQIAARFLPQWRAEHQLRIRNGVLRALEVDPESRAWRFYFILHTTDRAVIGDASPVPQRSIGDPEVLGDLPTRLARLPNESNGLLL
jgi:hypothetical protein